MSTPSHPDDGGTRRVDPIVRHALFGAARREVEDACSRLRAAMVTLDDDLRRLAHERHRLASAYREQRRRLWPVLVFGGRLPAPDGGEALPVAAADATALRVNRLRNACLALLARLGPLRLVELHAALHRYGFVVAGRHPVKVLADALGHETDHGRTVRIARGQYQLAPDTRPPRRLWRGGPPLPPPGHITENSTYSTP